VEPLLLWRFLPGCLFAACVCPAACWHAPLQSVSNIRFTDTNTDAGWIAGTITWDPPSDLTDVKYYAVLLFNNVQNLTKKSIPTPPNSTEDAGRRLLHEAWYLQDQTGKFYVDAGANHLTLKTLFGCLPRRGSGDVQPVHRRRYAWGHTRPPDRFIGVACMCKDMHHGPPMVLPIYDNSTVVPVNPIADGSLKFTDLDNRSGILQGTIEWVVPDEEDFTLSTHYSVYMSTDEAGGDAVFVGEVSIEANLTSLALTGYDRGQRDFILVRARNPNGLSEKAQRLRVFDLMPTVPVTGATNVVFTANQTAPEDQLAGTVTWSPPDDEAPISSYSVFVGCAQIGCTMSPQKLGEVVVGTHSLQFALARTNLMQNIQVYAQNDKGMQASPAYTLI